MRNVLRNFMLKLLVVCAVLMQLPSRCAANEALRPALSDLSEKVAKLLKGRGDEQISIGAFTGPSFTVSSSGPGISRILAEELKGHGVEISRRAKLEIKGDYRSIKERSSGLLELRIQSQIIDRLGETLLELNSRIEDPNVLAQVLGLNKPDLGEGVSAQKTSQVIAQLIDKPAVEVRDKTVRTNESSPYGIEILIKDSSGRLVSQPVSLEDGLPFVKIERGEVFAIRVSNNSKYDAAVELTLDGLSAFSFTQGQKYRHFIVRKQSNLVIKGWHRTNNSSDEFVVTRYADSAASELLVSPDQVGTITATFSAAWDPNGDPPIDERSKFRNPFENAVGRGKKVVTPFREVNLKLGRVRDIVSVRYNKP